MELYYIGDILIVTIIICACLFICGIVITLISIFNLIKLRRTIKQQK